MTLEEKETFFISESLKDRVDKNQFYEKDKNEKTVSLLYFLDKEDPASIDIDHLEIDRKEKTISIKFECNGFLTGQILDSNLKRVKVDFSGHIIERKISGLRKSSVKFLASDLCAVMLTFDFVDPI